MTSATALRRPMLAPHARHRWDAIRLQHQVVYPESALVLNETGATILKLCDGRTIDAIVADLERVSGKTGLSPDVLNFLQGLAELGLLRDADTA